MLKINKDSLLLNYGMLFFVIISWGVSPLFTNYMYKYNSAAIHTAVGQTFSVVTLLAIYAKKLKCINKELLLTAGGTGFILGVANILQKIGFQYTSPSNYAFLENLSVVVVPIIALIFYKKIPSILTIISCIICLVGCAFLCGLFNGFSLKIGDVLCALAGICYGVNISVTGSKAKKFDAGLYVLIQLIVGAIIAYVTAIALNFICINGKPIEPMKYTFRWDLILLCFLVVLITSTLCWTLRTKALRVVDSTVVALTMPLSSVITSVLSVLTHQEDYTPSLLIGGLLILFSLILSAVNNSLQQRKQIIKQQ